MFYFCLAEPARFMAVLTENLCFFSFVLVGVPEIRRAKETAERGRPKHFTLQESRRGKYLNRRNNLPERLCFIVFR